MAESGAVKKVIKAHEKKGRYIHVDNIKTFVLDQGKGEAVFCIHGVPTSSFLYRKVVDQLSGSNYRGVAIDLPGLGLSDRPDHFEYTFHNLAKFCSRAIEKLGLEKYHLVIHDIGGPIGFALAAENPEKILSLTILNTWIDVTNFKKPLPMRPFEKPIAGEVELAMINHLTWHVMFDKLGVEHSNKIPDEEVEAYVDLLKREDKGKAFLTIMRNFDDSEEFKELCYKAVQNVSYPIQIIWGANDPALKMDVYGEEIKEAAGLNHITEVPSKHFLQEECATLIVMKIHEIAKVAHEA